MSHDMMRVIEINKITYATFNLLGLLEQLDIKAAKYVHQDDVHDYVDRILSIKFL